MITVNAEGSGRRSALSDSEAGLVETVVDHAPFLRSDVPCAQACSRVGDHKRRGCHAKTLQPSEVGLECAASDHAVYACDPEQTAQRSRRHSRHPAPGVHDVGPPRQQLLPQRGRGQGVEAGPTPAHHHRDALVEEIAFERPSAHRPNARLPVAGKASGEEGELALQATVGRELTRKRTLMGGSQIGGPASWQALIILAASAARRRGHARAGPSCGGTHCHVVSPRARGLAVNERPRVWRRLGHLPATVSRAAGRMYWSSTPSGVSTPGEYCEPFAGVELTILRESLVGDVGETSRCYSEF